MSAPIELARPGGNLVPPLQSRLCWPMEVTNLDPSRGEGLRWVLRKAGRVGSEHFFAAQLSGNPGVR